MNDFLNKIFASNEAILTQKLEAIRAAFDHGGIKGAIVEEEFREFLRDILPGNIGVDTGQLVDCQGNRTKQLDIVCYDKAKTPKFFSAGGATLFPVECVYFVFEVKTVLTKQGLKQIQENMTSVKNLVPSAYYPNQGPLSHIKSFWGKTFETWQVIYGVLALEVKGADSVKSEFVKLQKDTNDHSKAIDSMFVLNTGAFLNAEPRSGNAFAVDFLPTGKSYPIVQDENALVCFLACFSRYYNQADLGLSLDLTKYLEFSLSFELIGLDDSENIINFIVDYMYENEKRLPSNFKEPDVEIMKIIETRYSQKYGPDVE